MGKVSLQGCALVVVAALGLGCTQQLDEVDGPLAFREQQSNGLALNAAVINGWHLNGWHLNGDVLNGWHLNGWHLNGWHLNGIKLQGTLFSGTQVIDGVQFTRSGKDFIGSELRLAYGTDEIILRIDDIFVDPAKPTGDVYFYAISVRDPVTSTWTSLCRDPDGQPTEAIPLQNYWNTTTGARVDSTTAVTLACRHAVLAKCVEWGYRPWATAKRCSGSSCQYVSLKDYHQACTRMARADYCGTGKPYTFAGTPIDVYDRLTPALQEKVTSGNANWAAEAEWGPNGAVCVGDSLRLKMLDDLGIDYDYPACLDQIDDISGCGALPITRPGRIANAYCAKWTDDPTQCEIGGKVVNDDDDDEDDDDGDDD